MAPVVHLFPLFRNARSITRERVGEGRTYYLVMLPGGAVNGLSIQ